MNAHLHFHSVSENAYISYYCNLVYIEQCATTQSFLEDCGSKRMSFPHNLLAALANNACLFRITGQPQGPAFWSGFLLFESSSKTTKT